LQLQKFFKENKKLTTRAMSGLWDAYFTFWLLKSTRGMKILESGYKIGLDFTMMKNRAYLEIATNSTNRFVDGLETLLKDALSMMSMEDGIWKNYCKRLKFYLPRFE
jgi:hypothetical protein